MSRNEPDIVQIFRSPTLAWLVDRIVKRLKQGEPLAGTVTKTGATDAERRAVDDLLGRPTRPGKSISLDLGALDEQFELQWIVEEIRGPVVDLRAAREAESQTWENLATRWFRRTESQEWARPWLEKLVSTGVLKRIALRDPEQADRLLKQAWEILGTQSHDEILLASLAVRVAGDSHALDRGRPLSALCLRGILERERIDGSGSAEARREAWAAVGVMVDDLSAPVLCLNLRAAAGNDPAPWIDWHVARGEPFFLPWRQVQRFEPSPEMERVFVCENPAIVSEAANRLGPSSRPLICMNGSPNGSVKKIVRRLLDFGIQVSVRADFDWAGLHFISAMRQCGTLDLWRMTSGDYLDCSPSQPLEGTPVTYNWAAPLAAAMERRNLAAHEENLVDKLTEDLAP